MKTKMMQLRLMSIMLYFMFCSWHVQGQGPIYNFNFNNQSEQKKVEEAKPSYQVQATNPGNQISQSQVPILPTSSASNYYLLLGGNYGGDSGPFQKHEKESVDEQLIEKRLEVGFGLRLTPRFDLLINGHHKKMSYQSYGLFDDYGILKGKALGFSTGPQYRLPLNASVTFLANLMFSMSDGKLEHPLLRTKIDCSYYYGQYCDTITQNLGNTKGDYKDKGAELGLGFDIMIDQNIVLGIMGKYSAYKVSLRSGGDTNDTYIPDHALGLVEHSKTRTYLGINLKFFL